MLHYLAENIKMFTLHNIHSHTDLVSRKCLCIKEMILSTSVAGCVGRMAGPLVPRSHLVIAGHQGANGENENDDYKDADCSQVRAVHQ